MGMAQSAVIKISVSLAGTAERPEGESGPEVMRGFSELMDRGVDLRFCGLDPDWLATGSYLVDRGEFKTLDEMRDGLRAMKRLRDTLEARPHAGSVRVMTFRHNPTYHAIVVDPDEQDLGHMLVTPHLHGVKQSDAPVMQLSHRSNPELFETLWTSIQQLTDQGQRVW